ADEDDAETEADGATTSVVSGSGGVIADSGTAATPGESAPVGAVWSPPSSARCFAAAETALSRATFCSKVSPGTGPVSTTPAYVVRRFSFRSGLRPSLEPAGFGAGAAAGFAAGVAAAAG